MKHAAILAALAALVLCAGQALALQERTITDEPSVSKPQAPAGPSAPAPGATPAPAEKPAPAPSGGQAGGQGKPSQGAAGGTWTPAETREAPKTQAGSGTGTSGDASGSSTGSSGGRVFDMPEAKKVETYSRKEVDEQVMGFFEGGARGLADLISRAFERHGEPVGFIKGGEGAGALVVGLRYGEGWLYLKNGQKAYVYWQSPSVGFDLGVNTSKVFCLIYNMTSVDQIYQRFPSVDGSAYILGGFGMNYQNSGGIVLAPIRFGVGLRLGANLGYMHFTRERTINPF